MCNTTPTQHNTDQQWPARTGKICVNLYNTKHNFIPYCQVNMGNCNTKCSYCEGRTDSDHRSEDCREPSTCTCKCCVGGAHDVAQKTSAIATGVGLTIGGIALCLLSGGIAAPFVGAAVAGTGVSSAANGITKAARGEKMDAADFFIDTGVGAASGLLTAGGGAAGGLLKKATEEGVKMTVKETAKHIAFKTAVMGATGCGQAAMAEGINCTKPLEKEKKEKGEKREFNPHCLWVGAAVGALGAAGSSISKGAANRIADGCASNVAGSVLNSRGVVKTATRFGGEAVTGATKGAVNAAGKFAVKPKDSRSFDLHELWAGAATGGASSLCRDATGNLIKNYASKPEVSSSSTPATTRYANIASNNSGKRFMIRAGSAVVETTATEVIQQAKQEATGEVDKTRHFGKSFSIGLFESMNSNLGRYPEKYSTRKSRLKNETKESLT